MRKLLTCLALLFGAFLLFTGGDSAGAAPNPCYVHGDDGDGWYWNHDKVMQCVQDGNHYVVRQWGAGGVDEGVVFNAWLPASTYAQISAGVPYTGYSYFRVCPTTWNGVNSVFVTPNGAPSGWEQHFWWFLNNTPVYAGAVNHFYGWAGVQAYGEHQDLAGGCIYGGDGVSFYRG